MNKQYIQPSIEVIECELEGAGLCLSGGDLRHGGSADDAGIEEVD